MTAKSVGPEKWAALQQQYPYLRWGVFAGDPPGVWVPDDANHADEMVAVARRRRAPGQRSLLFVVPRGEVRADSDLGPVIASLAAELIAHLNPSGLTVPRPLAASVYRSLIPLLLPPPEGGSDPVRLDGADPLQLGDAETGQVGGGNPGQVGGAEAPQLAGAEATHPAGAEAPQPAGADPPSLIGEPGGIGWDWMWTTQRVPPAAREHAAASVAAAGVNGGPLDIADPAVRAEIEELLDVASPRHSAEPGDSRVQLWFGFRDRSRGTLVACAAWYESVPGIPLLASVAVHSDLRRAGLGRALMVAITERAFDAGSPAVTVDLYDDNDAARQLYLSLGFVLEQQFASWSLAGLTPRH